MLLSRPSTGSSRSSSQTFIHGELTDRGADARQVLEGTLSDTPAHVKSLYALAQLSADAGDRWAPIVRDLPAVVSVEVQTLP